MASMLLQIGEQVLPGATGLIFEEMLMKPLQTPTICDLCVGASYETRL